MPAGIAIFGITGRMGPSLLRALAEPDGSAFVLRGALASPSSPRLGSDAGLPGTPAGVTVTADPRIALQGAAVALDFSLPQSVGAHAAACRAAHVPLLVGATGFDSAVRTRLEAAAADIPVLVAPNTSIGVSVLARLVRLATLALGAAYDVEISEIHHRMKRDAPSGTALHLGEIVAEARGRSLAEVAVYDRHGRSGPRAPGDIGFVSLRAGDVVGEHTVTFAAAGERVEITHRATDRVTFARGALAAARWLMTRPPGLYSMQDVLEPPPTDGEVPQA